MSRVEFVIDPASLERARNMLDPVGYAIAAQAAISRTVTSGQAHAARLIGQTLNLRIGDIKKTIAVKKSSYSRLEGSIQVTRKPVPLAEFHARQTRAGAAVKVWKDKPRQMLKHTFVATMKSGHVGVFERKRGATGTLDSSTHPGKFIVGGKGKKLFMQMEPGFRGKALSRAAPSGRVWRLPIVERYGPNAVTAVVGNKNHPGKEQAIVLDLSETLAKNVEQQINRVLNAPGSIVKLRQLAARSLN